MDIISEQQIENRVYWIDEISRLSGNFGVDAARIESELSQEISKTGIDTLLGHLRLCGAIPESYKHDSSEEKMYSKYTDAVIHEAFKAMGFTSLVLKERADVADVECVTEKYSFVADAKAFRLRPFQENNYPFVIPAKAGIHAFTGVDSCLRRNDRLDFG
jgi:HindIII restriction endonuclease